MFGLRVNLPRIEARQVLLMARAFQLAQPGSTDKANDLMELAEVPSDDRTRGDIQQWFEDQKARARR